MVSATSSSLPSTLINTLQVFRSVATRASVTEVMISGYLRDDGVYAARSEGDAPDIDSYVFVRSAREWNTGDFVRVRITGASEYDLEGVPEDEFYEDEPAE